MTNYCKRKKWKRVHKDLYSRVHSIVIRNSEKLQSAKLSSPGDRINKRYTCTTLWVKETNCWYTKVNNQETIIRNTYARPRKYRNTTSMCETLEWTQVYVYRGQGQRLTEKVWGNFLKDGMYRRNTMTCPPTPSRHQNSQSEAQHLLARQRGNEAAGCLRQCPPAKACTACTSSFPVCLWSLQGT